MEAQPSLEIHGDWNRRLSRPPRPTRLLRPTGTVAVANADSDADDGLYRYVPVPPVCRDADGYPVEDGMSQNQDHQQQTAHWCDALKRHCPAATVGSDLPVHYKRGDRDKVLVPDLFVALRAPRLGDRSSYKLWENPTPELVIEMLSPGRSWKSDVGSKRRTCEMLGVREYWLFEPPARRLSAPLEGYRLRGRRYRRIGADAAGRFPSEVLGLDLHVRDGRLRFRDPATGEDLATYDESAGGRALAEAGRAEAEAGRAEAERREANERDARKMAEQRVDEAERELERLRLRFAELERAAPS